MAEHWRSTDSDNEDGEEEDDFNLAGRDGIIFLVDCAESMFLPVEEDDPRSKFRIAIECIEAVMRNRIIMSDSDLVCAITCLAPLYAYLIKLPPPPADRSHLLQHRTQSGWWFGVRPELGAA